MPTPTLTMPQTLCTAFSEARAYEQLRNQYHDGTPEAAQLALTSRRTFKLARRLSSANANALYQFYLNVGGGLKPFWFYNPYEPATGMPIGSNYDPTGNGRAGRYCVAFRNNWTQATGLGRTDVTGLELIELPAPHYVVNGNGSSSNPLVGLTLSVTAAWIPGGGSALGSPVVDMAPGAIDVSGVDNSPGAVGLDTSGLTAAPSTLTYVFDLSQGNSLASISVLAMIVSTLYGTDTPAATLNVYDAALTLRYKNGTSTIQRPVSTATSTGESGGIFGGGVSGEVANPGNAIDGDPSSFASVTRTNYDSLSSAGYLQVIF